VSGTACESVLYVTTSPGATLAIPSFRVRGRNINDINALLFLEDPRDALILLRFYPPTRK
jgi:hypothetical protein